MHIRMRWLIGTVAVLMFIMTACADGRTIEKPAPPETLKDNIQQSHDITLNIDGSTFIPDVTRSLHFEYMEGLTVREALESSGIVRLMADQTGIQSVGEVSLDSALEWGVRLNDKELGSSRWDQELQVGDQILVYVKTVESNSVIPEQSSLLLIVDGGTRKKYFVNQYDENTTVRDLLKRSGIVQFNANNKYIVSVSGYTLQENEQWVLKVNGKKLLDNGLDMRLKPQDNVEMVLMRR